MNVMLDNVYAYDNSTGDSLKSVEQNVQAI